MTLLETVTALALLALIASATAVLSRDATTTFEAVRREEAWLVAAERALDSIDRAITYGDISTDVDHRTERACQIMDQGSGLRVRTWPSVILPSWAQSSSRAAWPRGEYAVVFRLHHTVIVAVPTTATRNVTDTQDEREVLREVARVDASALPDGSIRIEITRVVTNDTRACSVRRTISNVRRVSKEELP